MKHLLFLFGVLISIWTLGQNEIDPEYKAMIEKKYDFPTISQDSAQSLLNTKGVYFLDTREKEEYNVSHLPELSTRVTTISHGLPLPM